MLKIMVSTVEEVSGKKADMTRAVNAHHNFCQCGAEIGACDAGDSARLKQKALKSSRLRCENCRFYDAATGEVRAAGLRWPSPHVALRSFWRSEEQKLWVTRKGATSAREGEYGIIPGSMGVAQ